MIGAGLAAALVVFVRPSKAAAAVVYGDGPGTKSPIDYAPSRADPEKVALLTWRISDAQYNLSELLGELSRPGISDDQRAALEAEVSKEELRLEANQNELDSLGV